MSGINRQPRGLLSFFGIKNTGRNPRAIGDTLAPVIDLARWYLAQNSESFVTNANVTDVGFNSWITVPEFETWAILGCTVNSQNVLGAGQTMQIQGAWARGSPLGSVVAPLTAMGNAATTGTVAYAFGSVGEIEFLPPGASVGAYCTNLTAGPVASTINLTRVVMSL